MKLMIVDDNELMRKTIIDSVANVNDTVLECQDGETALLKCLDFNPDWILMDVRMKNLNGIIAAQKIREIMPKANIAMLTNYNIMKYKEMAKSIGAKHYFLKNNLLTIREKLTIKTMAES